MAAAPIPEKTIATPKLVIPTIKIKFLKGILDSPALSVISSAKPGTGLDKINPIVLKFFNAFSASLNSAVEIIFFAIGRAAMLPRKYPIQAPKLRPIQTTIEDKPQPNDMPDKVLVRPLGTGKITSAINAAITINEMAILLVPAQANAASAKVDKGVSKKIKGKRIEVKNIMLKEVHLIIGINRIIFLC